MLPPLSRRGEGEDTLSLCENVLSVNTFKFSENGIALTAMPLSALPALRHSQGSAQNVRRK